MKSERLPWIDVCKAIAIFFMVFCHVGLEVPSDSRVWISKSLDNFIHLWHMPIFYFISGYVLNLEKYSGWHNYSHFIYTRVRTIIIPLLAYALLSFLISTVFNLVTSVPFDQLMREIIYPNHYSHYSYFQWFLISLFLTESVYVAIHNLVNKKRFAVLAIFATSPFVGWFLLSKHLVEFPFAIDTLFFTMPLFALGTLIRRKDILYAMNCHSYWVVIILVCLAALSIRCPWAYNIRSCLYQPKWVYGFSMVITIAVIFVVKYFSKYILLIPYLSSYLQYLGRNTIIVLLLNTIVRRSLPIHNFAIVGGIQMALFQILWSVAVIVIISIVSIPINKYVPWSLGRIRR